MTRAKSFKLGTGWAFALMTSLCALAMPSAAQSLFGCSDLNSAHVPSIEGENGVFFRIDPDLLTFHRMTQATVQDVAALSRALGGRGTQLVFVSLPTKALAMPFDLGPEALKVAYDTRLAATMYDSQIARLKAAKVTVVDARGAFLADQSHNPPFFKTDPRLNNDGLQVLSSAIAEVVGGWPYSEGAGFTTRAVGTTTLDSLNHQTLQLNCLSELPEVTTMAFETVAMGADYAMDNGPRVVFVGSNLTADPSLNMSGFLSQAAGERVKVISGADDTLAGLVSYLTSDAFRQSPPEVLVWTVPIAANLAIGGDQPLREALAVVEGRCVSDLAVDAVGENRLRVVLAGVDFGPEDTLYLDNSAIDSDRAAFHFVATGGRERIRMIQRANTKAATGRFYMPLSALWPEGVAYVDIETTITDELPSVALCKGGS